MQLFVEFSSFSVNSFCIASKKSIIMKLTYLGKLTSFISVKDHFWVILFPTIFGFGGTLQDASMLYDQKPKYLNLGQNIIPPTCS